jgi:adenosylcobinamide kinase/adenosylcobinamide-phosphate guanylyltransferase
MTRTLVLGGARSGKSAWPSAWRANRARKSSMSPPPLPAMPKWRPALHIIATPARRNGRRSKNRWHWATSCCAGLAPDRLMLVDCLTLWLSNLMFSSGEEYPEVGEIVLPALFHGAQDMLASAADQVRQRRGTGVE